MRPDAALTLPAVILPVTETVEINVPLAAPMLPTLAFPVTVRTPPVLMFPPEIFPVIDKILPASTFAVTFPVVALKLPEMVILVTPVIFAGRST